VLQRKHVNSRSHTVYPDAQHAQLLPPTLCAVCLHLSGEMSPQNLHLPGISISH